MNLEELAREIKNVVAEADNEDKDAHSRFLRSLELRRVAGSMLLEAKNRGKKTGEIPHGQWEQWVEVNCELEYRTCARLMQLVKDWPQVQERLKSVSRDTVGGRWYDLLRKEDGGEPGGEQAPRKPAKWKKTRGSDDYYTPPSALAPLLPFLPPSQIWEPACGTGNLAKSLTGAGWSVVGTDIKTGADFFGIQPPDGTTAIVTNPPYSRKEDWIKRSYALGLPFALLLPLESLQPYGEHFDRHGVEVLVLRKRVKFEVGVTGQKSLPTFPVGWFCWRLLPKPLMWG